MSFIDLTGQKFGRLTVIEKVINNGGGRTRWLCICDCGKTSVVADDKLKSGHTKSCGCLKSKHIYKDLIGQKFGRLLVVRYAGQKNDHKVFWECMCECGNSKIIATSHLTNRHTVSCGCYQKEMIKQISSIHGLAKTRLFGIWNGVLQRCYNPNRKKYKNYGARGIKVCDDWRHNFKNFYDWAMTNGYQDNLTIERVDNNGNYEPSNCRWATWEEQSYNKTTSRFITYKDETKTIAEWSKLKGLKQSTICARLGRGWSEEKTLESPLMVNKYKFK